MRIGIFDPYLDTLGGGEKYILTLAECLCKDNAVFVFWNNPKILEQAAKRFDLNIKEVNLAPNIFASSSIIKRIKETRKFDLIIYISDGSIPFLYARKNILLLQFPVNWINAEKLLTRIKLLKISGIICYSQFVQKFLEKTFSKKIFVLAPAIDDPLENINEKENIILNVGRFTQAMNMKKQAMMIESFKKLKDKNWRLVLLGGALPQDKEFIKSLRESSKDFPIEIHENVSIEFLQRLYAKARIYWHATGFGEDLINHPELAEHFGITTLEAMSYGAVPVIINAGGQPELITDGKDGFLWKDEGELLEKTKKLMENSALREEMSKEAIQKAKQFNKREFCKRVKEIIA